MHTKEVNLVMEETKIRRRGSFRIVVESVYCRNFGSVAVLSSLYH